MGTGSSLESQMVQTIKRTGPASSAAEQERNIISEEEGVKLQKLADDWENKE